MAETATKNPLEALGRKVGPLPLGAWLLIGGGLYLYMRHKQQAAAGASPAAQASQTGYGTDPAGNVGYIDPQSGYVYGSAEDIAALQSQGQVAANSYNTGGTGATSGTGAGAGALDTGGGGPLTPSGTPTTTPGTTSPPVSTTGAAAPRSGSWQYPAPSGLTANSVTDTGFGVSWSPVQGPNGQKPGTYTVQTYQGNTKVDQFVSGSTNTREYGAGGRGLRPATTYAVNVWANGGPVAPPHASISVTTKPRGGK